VFAALKSVCRAFRGAHRGPSISEEIIQFVKRAAADRAARPPRPGAPPELSGPQQGRQTVPRRAESRETRQTSPGLFSAVLLSSGLLLIATGPPAEQLSGQGAGSSVWPSVRSSIKRRPLEAAALDELPLEEASLLHFSARSFSSPRKACPPPRERVC